MDSFSRFNWDFKRNENFMRNAKIVYYKAGKVYQAKSLNVLNPHTIQDMKNVNLLLKGMEL